mmetsp:Transcript_88141/g.273946  ORF Transcript_88141/g.273946 Transcript_88141/m.273946 type:complete len:90 (+) Transcript_88141:715-984(+)
MLNWQSLVGNRELGAEHAAPVVVEVEVVELTVEVVSVVKVVWVWVVEDVRVMVSPKRVAQVRGRLRPQRGAIVDVLPLGHLLGLPRVLL